MARATDPIVDTDEHGDPIYQSDLDRAKAEAQAQGVSAQYLAPSGQNVVVPPETFVTPTAPTGPSTRATTPSAQETANVIVTTIRALEARCDALEQMAAELTQALTYMGGQLDMLAKVQTPARPTPRPKPGGVSGSAGQ